MAPGSADRRASPRRRTLDLACLNSALWGLGDGLASVSLVSYLAREYQASPRAFAWIMAIPSLAALVRLGAPAWLARVRNRRRFVVGTFAASATTLAAMAILSAPGVLAAPGHSLVALVIGWGVFQGLEQVAAVGLWEWLGDAAPGPIRGRFVGRREGFMNAGRAIGGGIAAAAMWFWLAPSAVPRPAAETVRDPLRGYVACVLAGASLFLLACWPLARMDSYNRPYPRSCGEGSRARLRTAVAGLLAPLVDRRYRRLLVFGAWFSFANGVFQSVRRPLEMGAISFHEKKVLDGASRGMQSLVMPAIGKFVDRRGNRLPLVASQAVIAAAPLCFLGIAMNQGRVDPATRFWILGAYACWLAYAAQNVVQPNLMLGLAPRPRRANYIAVWFAVNQLAVATGIFMGAEWLARWQSESSPRVDRFAPLLWGATALMAGAAWKGARVPEPARDDDDGENASGNVPEQSG